MSQPRKSKPGSIDAYLADVPSEQRAALERLRKIIKAAVPEAEECISYGLPAYRLDGRVLVYFGASAKHCSFFPGSGTIVASLAHLLKDYDTSKGTIRFQPDRPLPVGLVRKIIKARIAENRVMSHRSQKSRGSGAGRHLRSQAVSPSKEVP